MEEKQSEEGRKDDKGCFILPQLKGSEFLICVNMKTLDNLFLFHYSWRNRKLNEVVDITYTSRWPATMKFSNGKSEQVPSYLKSNFAWLQKNWKNTTFLPSHCKITKKDNGGTDYELTCNNPSGVSEKPHWSQKIPLSHITVHKNAFNSRK